MFFKRKRTLKENLNHHLNILSQGMDIFIKGNAFIRASALTYTTILSIIPLFFISISILSSFQVSRELVTRSILKFIVPTEDLLNILTDLFNTFAQNSAATGVFGGIFFIITIASLFWTIENAFNSLWNKKRDRSKINQITALWTVATITPLLIAASIVVSGNISSSFLSQIPGFSFMVVKLSPILIQLVGFTIFFLVVPQSYVRFKSAFYGAFTSVILFTVSKSIFAYYLNNFATYDKIYGLLGVFPAFLIWLFIMWSIILFGAKIAYLEDSNS
jgi:membrane protein